MFVSRDNFSTIYIYKQHVSSTTFDILFTLKPANRLNIITKHSCIWNALYRLSKSDSLPNTIAYAMVDSAMDKLIDQSAQETAKYRWKIVKFFVII